MSRATGIAASLALMGAGAIMAFAIRVTTAGATVHTLGWMLIQIGAAGLLVALMIGNVESDELLPASQRQPPRSAVEQFHR